ncbi:thiamine pyrophosphate-dependent dehydrogenase E1 component subunit alpha [Saccharolobus islandicus]|uniref:2-oxoacid oxidoreductase (ferredoxin) n=3 Tax=Saccharolobus islandicus TaxID=43080 RepID=M9U9T3_SACIS|nr:thiamine pyrophosphate-dependent dehydrogenase E1 component subunit alpha [Sulfolobus islandicus]ADX83817.1 Pyruvate dehydrogenase (acetyl-transferring) [Sulfolobus islandicus HVE10/4]ADX86453.1 Pyruvate dehydrogenase (acetyl-transferring) [Sulfolobus islandicus REY15A]AGJ63814.1 Pyruvate/2-oxoglutarate dehydrogenase complex, dehydrogenase (E1) component, eukaryotic type, alpha subunit [Sulfolobus islandicus LAL14/1]WCM37475.1 pyruvate dehydrogenase (acetyl-transferring) E1 component subunit
MIIKPEPSLKDLSYLIESSGLKPSDLLNMYRRMLTIRYFEETIRKIYHEGKNPFNMASGIIRGEMHLSIGQEAVAVGTLYKVRDEDVVVSTHRPHHHAIAKGVDANKLAAEILGKVTGLCRGKGGHMHLFDKTKKFACSGIVGASFPQAAGAAFAFKYSGKDNVAIAFAGEGAANHGTFAETLNIASAWELPLILVIEDNKYADSTPKSFVMSTTFHYQRGLTYNVPSYLVDGMDVIDVYSTARKAIERARKGFGPTLIEALTYRYVGHFEGDSEEYRTKEEVEMWSSLDPIRRLENRILRLNYADNEILAKLREEARKQVQDAIDFALRSPYPDPNEALTGVFA